MVYTASICSVTNTGTRCESKWRVLTIFTYRCTAYNYHVSRVPVWNIGKQTRDREKRPLPPPSIEFSEETNVLYTVNTSYIVGRTGPAALPPIGMCCLLIPTPKPIVYVDLWVYVFRQCCVSRHQNLLCIFRRTVRQTLCRVKPRPPQKSALPPGPVDSMYLANTHTVEIPQNSSAFRLFRIARRNSFHSEWHLGPVDQGLFPVQACFV